MHPSTKGRFARKRFVWFLVLSLGSVSALAQAKPAWEWTVEERIARRLDPGAVRERLQAQPSGDGAAAAAITGKTALVIDGQRNPELFMTWELIDVLLATLGSGEREAGRQGYDGAIVAAGWAPAEFWQFLTAIGTPYAEARDAQVRLQKELRTADRIAARGLRSDLLRWQSILCAQRAVALRKARERYGATAFDTFLYQSVAPGLSLASAQPAAASHLRWVEAGCQ